jgi:hypothetical protein
MSRPRYYSPAIKRHLVTALYHEAKRQGRPMTHLTNEIVEKGLGQRQGDGTASAIVLHETAPPFSHAK